MLPSGGATPIQCSATIDLPDEEFDLETGPAGNGLTLYERRGRGQIDVYAMQKDEELNLEQLREELSPQTG